MINKIANLKLESFFSSKKITKKSSLGYFSDVVTEEDLKSISTMVHKMVMLPKYEKIKNQLKSANGIVNFVTYDEFEPLVEMIFKTSVPPSSNDIYHMGQGFTLPEDYFIDAKGFFGDQSADAQVSQSALRRLSVIVNGSPKKMTTEWLKANGLDPDGDAFVSVFGEGAIAIREALEKYQNDTAALENSDLKTEIDELFRKIDRDRIYNNRLKEVEEFNKGKPEAQRKALPKTLSKNEIISIRKELRLKRGFYARSKANVENEAGILNIPDDMFSHQAEERGGGFLNWSPDDEISRVYVDIIDSEGSISEAQMEIKFSNLQVKMEDYRTTDPDLIEKRDHVLSFLNTENVVHKFTYNSATFTRLMSEFISRANKHGKMMIFKGVDNSALTTAPITAKPSGPSSGTKLNNCGVLSDFIAANNANMVRDMQGGKRTARGKRTIIMISSQPLQDMPSGSSKIEMDMSPVDEAEADIIVNALADAYVNDAATASTLKMAYDVEKKYEGLKDSDAMAKKDLETSQIGEILMASKTSLAYISPEGRKKIEQMIIGVGQKAAINKVREVFSTHAQYEKDEEGILSGINFDEKVLIKDMIDEITLSKAEDVPGLRMRESKVKFKDYITKKGSGWGNEVGVIAFRCQSLGFYDQQIEGAREEISQIDFELRDAKFSPATKREKLESRKGWERELQRYIGLKNGVITDIPHYMVLRGKPGVGKSVWGDAIADLLGYLIYNVDISDVFDKWLGNSEKNTNKLIETIFNSRDAVYLIDEVDRMLDMGGDSGGEGGGAQGGHPTEKKVIAKFLEAFGERLGDLKDRNIFVIMTTNHVNAIDNALLKRTKGEVYDVQASDDPEDFLKFLDTFLETERRDTPNHPWIRAGGNSNEEMWDYTIKFVKENIDLRHLATIFATRQLSFRSLSGLIEKACKKHNAYANEFLGAVARGEPVTPKGMPLTTANLANAAMLVEDSASDATKFDLGIDTVYGQVIQEAEEAWKTINLEEVQVAHPVTGEMKTEFKIPDSITKIMEGTEIKEDNQQFEVADEEVENPNDPSVKRRQVYLRPSTPKGQGINDLADQGMEEDTMQEGPNQEKVSPEEEEGQTKKKDTQGKTASSSEYLYRYLVDKGVVDSEGLVVSKKVDLNKTKKVKNVDKAEPFDTLEQYGTYYFNDNQMIIMSVSEGMPPLRFFN